MEHGERKRSRIGTWGEEEIEDWNMGRGRDRGLEHGERKRLRIGTWGEEEIEVATYIQTQLVKNKTSSVVKETNSAQPDQSS